MFLSLFHMGVSLSGMAAGTKYLYLLNHVVSPVLISSEPIISSWQVFFNFIYSPVWMCLLQVPVSLFDLRMGTWASRSQAPAWLTDLSTLWMAMPFPGYHKKAKS